MPNISVKRLIKKAAVSPAPFHSPGRRGRVKKKKNKTKNKLVVKTTGQFPYHRSKDISSSGPVTALEKSRKAELIRTVRSRPSRLVFVFLDSSRKLQSLIS